MSRKSVLYFSAGVVTALSVVLFHNWWSRKETVTARKKVLCFGDSITQHGFNPEDGWVSNLAYWWARRVDILNRGFSGYNSRWAVKMLDDVVIAERPDFIFIFFGANDAVDESVLQHVPLAEYRRNMENMVARIQRALPSIPIVIISPPPVDEGKLSLANKEKGRILLIDRTNERTLTYVNACKDISSKYGLLFVDLYAALEGSSPNRADYLIDGLHLNAKGNKAVFNAIRKLLSKELSDWTPEMMPMHMPEWSKLSSDPRFQ